MLHSQCGLVPPKLYLACPVIRMPRRNQHEKYVPLDLTPESFPTKPDPIGYGSMPRFEIEHRAKMRQLERGTERINRQEQAAAQAGIDWSLCLVPGCGKSLVQAGRANHWPEERDTSRHLPLCYEHGIIAWRQVQRASDLPLIIETAAEIESREQERLGKIRAESTARIVARDGLIYFVRMNDLVKVGWTSNFRRRLKEYGAGAEVLCHYPATREDETALHRQLRQALAKGREWYHDGDVIRLFVDQALKRYGQPTITAAYWTTPRKEPIKPRRR